MSLRKQHVFSKRALFEIINSYFTLPHTYFDWFIPWFIPLNSLIHSLISRQQKKKTMESILFILCAYSNVY